MTHYTLTSVLFVAFFSPLSLLAQPAKRAPRARLVEKSLTLEQAPRVEKEIARLQQARARGAQHYAITFSPYGLFWKSEDEHQLDTVEAENDRQIVEAALDEGLTLMGVLPTWVIPPFANPPLVPGMPEEWRFGPPEARISCLPDRGSPEYSRLSGVRDRMYATLVAEYPSVRYWIVGYEASFPFFDCAGRQLTFDVLIPYVADTLKGVRTAIRAVDGQALVVSHFLGMPAIPIEIAGQLVQPREVLEALSAEIHRRGELSGDYYDEMITTFAPQFGLDRHQEPPSQVLFLARSPSYDGTPLVPLFGWSSTAYWYEEFNTTTTDLVADYDEWNDWRTTVYIEPTTVSSGSGEATMVMDEGNHAATIMGAVSHPDEVVVPDENAFDSETWNRNKWVAVVDFYAGIATGGAGVHLGSHLRVNDRTWEGNADQTRFGSFAYGGLIDAGECNNEHCGALQLSGDDITDSSKGKGELIEFTLSELPWDNTSDLYRLQIIEEERLHPLSFVWEHWWQAEIWNLTDTPPTLIGDSAEIGEWTLENIYGIAEPPLTDSKIGVGFGPAIDPWDGSVDVDFVGTAVWEY